jgi:uncharacterized protein with NRDE domain
MCTVVFIPNNSKPYIASIRDENPNRPSALIPTTYNNNCINAIYPKDITGDGTWVGANEYGHIIVLLNGGFKNHERKQKYEKSRGLIVKDMLHHQLPVDNWESYNLNNIEPFTLVVWQNGSLYQLVWDGAAKHLQILDQNKAHIWSSSTLYNSDAKLYRKNLFDNWINSNPITNAHTIISFFNTYINNENGYIMHRNEVLKTLSFTILYSNTLNDVAINYTDCALQQQVEQHLQLESLKLQLQ